MIDAWARSRSLTPRPSPLSFGAAGSSFGVGATPKLSPPSAGSGIYAPPAVTPSETNPPEKKPDDSVMRAEADATPVHTAPPIVNSVLGASGQPLEAGVRTLMEARFGRSFGDVRVHHDAQAAASAAAVHAHAYTAGRHIVFAAGRYAPHTPEGKRLMAHELAHVVQQTGGAQSGSGGVRSVPAAIMRADDAVAQPDPVAVALKGDDNDARALTLHPKWPEIKITPKQAATLLIQLLDGATLNDDEQAGLRILRKLLKDKLFDEGLQALTDQGRLPQLLDDYHGDEYRELLKLLSENMTRRGVKTVYLDAFIAMWWVREHEEEAIVVVLERTPLTDQVALLANTSRIGDLRDAIDTERLSRRYEAIIAGVLGSQGQDLKSRLQGIFVIAANQSVAQGKRTQAEIGRLLSLAAVDLVRELADYKRRLDSALSDPKVDAGEIAKINKEFEKRLEKLIQDKSTEFGLELKYNVEFNRLLGETYGRAWTPKDLTRIDELLAKFPEDLLRANTDLSGLRRSAINPAEPGLAGQAGGKYITLFGDLTFDTTIHEVGHFIHGDDDKLFDAFRALSGWELLTVADFTKLIPDQKDRTKLLKVLDADRVRATTDTYFQGDPHEFDGFIYRFSRYDSDPANPRYFRLKKDACFITPYAATEPKDDFAETFAAYFDKPAELQQKCPDKFKFMHVRVMVEYRLGKQRGRVLKTFDDVVTKQFTDIDLLLGDTFKRAYADPLRADLVAALDKQAATKKAEAERTANQKPQPIPKAAEAEQLAKPYLDKLNALAKAAVPLLRGKQRFDDHAKDAKALIFDPMQTFAYDAVILTLSKRLADSLTALYDPVAKGILAENLPQVQAIRTYKHSGHNMRKQRT
ncbi:MAG: DUF4157 domain-containing protein [Anaerolineales bacterium]|nr:DUF4157 domain-containing protein [Anaerolineales bacterium]